MCAECVIATVTIVSSSVSLATLALGVIKNKKKQAHKNSAKETK